MAETAHKPSMKRDEPIRVFKSDFLEFFTHISPIAVLALWIPAIGVFLALGIIYLPAFASPWIIPVGFVVGMGMWTFVEYMLHRFLFHYHAKSDVGKRISFMFHGIHHEQPMIKTRLVMPPIVSIPLALIFYGLYTLIFGVIAGIPWWINPLFAGTSLGYLLYDMTHYATHHFNIKNPIFKWIRSHHMKHHVQTPNKRFGVTSPIWDLIFKTEPKEEQKKQA